MGYRSTTCFSKRTHAGLMTYESENEALNQAQYSKGAYNTDLTAYRCGRCKLWHLAPNKTRPSPVKCGYCCGRDGEPKTLYSSELIARETADMVRSNPWMRLRPYKCPHLEGWHLTSK